MTHAVPPPDHREEPEHHGDDPRAQARTEPVRVLVVDDEPAIRHALLELLRGEGYDVQSAADGFKALGRVEQWVPDVVISDVKMPALGGMELMARLREQQPDIAVIIMTAHGSVEGAVEAMRLGADDYLSKPVHMQQLLLLLERVIARRALAREAQVLRSALVERGADTSPEVIGQTRVFLELLELARQLASSPVPMLITGPSGAGKQFLARLIHQWSGCSGPLVTLLCGTLGEAALERELFGSKDEGCPAQDGALCRADGGTLLLVDLDELSPNLQARLLAALKERTFQRIGDGQQFASSARVLATTSRDLAAEAKAGRFRKDLYFRLAAVNLRVPSLRERSDDISRLAAHFVRRHAKQRGKRISGCSERVMSALLAYEWPGNVAQLERCIERAVVVARNAELEPRDLPRDLMAKPQDDAAPLIPGASLWEIERYAILKTLEHVGGRTSKAAKLLGISTRKIQYRLNEYDEASRLAGADPGPGEERS